MLSACDSPTAPAREGDIALSVALSSDSFTLGDTLEISITVSSLTDREVGYTTGGCPFSIRLVGSQNTSYISGNACTLLMQGFTLLAGQDAVHVQQFTGWAYSYGGDLEMVPPGSYTLEVQLLATELAPSAAPVPVEIRPAAP